MWFRSVGVAGEAGTWVDEDISAAFSLLGLDFDFVVTADDNEQVSKLARRYCYNNKYHDRVKKVEWQIVEALNESGGVLMYFGKKLNNIHLEAAISTGIPVYIFPPGFRENLEKSWRNSELMF